jgi:hypothetical protein
MLPGFRVLLAAIALTFSTVIFALGAAALLRASHERFASLPALRVPEPASPTLAMLQVEPAITAPSLPATEAADPPQSTPTVAASPEPETIADTSPDLVRTGEAATIVAALAPDAGTAREASPEPSPEPSVESSAAPVSLPEPAPARSEPLAISPDASVTGRQAEIRTAALAPADMPAAAPPVADTPNTREESAETPATTAALDQAAPEPAALPPPVAIEGAVPLPKPRAAALAYPVPRIGKPRKRRMATQADRARPVRRAPSPAAMQQQQQPFPGLFPFQ